MLVYLRETRQVHTGPGFTPTPPDQALAQAHVFQR